MSIHHLDKNDALQLGPRGPGYLALSDAIPAGLLHEVQSEIAGSGLVWRNQDDTVTTPRGTQVTQGFEYIAHKLSRGSQEFIDASPALRKLLHTVIGQAVQPLTEQFPSLNSWKADEVSIQRYGADNGHIDWHFDRSRYTGIIAIANIVGTATLGVVDSRDQYKRAAYLQEGDMLLLRAPSLYLSSNGLSVEHAVLQTSEGRTSVTFRANSRPDDSDIGFTFHNWPTT